MIRHTDAVHNSNVRVTGENDDKVVNPFDDSSDEEPIVVEDNGTDMKQLSKTDENPGGSKVNHELGTVDVTPVSETETEKPAANFLKFHYYQQFFDVDTQQVLRRLFWSAVPQLGEESYVELHIQPKPDLYGPFWIAATLACTTTMASTIVNIYYSSGKKYLQRYDYNKASVAATVTYLYTFMVPSIVWSVLRYKGESRRFSLLDLICLYGYSLAVYIPVSILWIMQPSWLQWVLVVIAAIVSGCVLILSFKKVFDEIDKKVTLVLIVIIISLHMFLAFGFAAYFLQPNYNILLMYSEQ